MKELNEMLGKDDLTSFLYKCRTDFEFFCNNVLKDIFSDGGIQPYMMEWFNTLQKNDRVVILAPRGFAKTTIIGIAYPLWLMFTKRNLKIMIVSQSETRAKETLSILKLAIETNPLLIELKPKDARETWSAKQINTTTGCKYFCRPFTKTIKGERVDYNFMDEGASYEKPELYFDYVVPTLNPGGKTAIITTPEIGANLVSMIEERNLDYAFKVYPAIVNNESIWAQRFPMEKLKKIRDELGEQFFQKNFMCNPRAEGGLSIYTAASLRLCSDRQSGFTSKTFGGDLFIGCDFAIASGPTADFDAYIVIERLKDSAIIKYGEFHRGWTVEAKVNRIEDLVERYNPQIVICDESSIGAAVIEELRARGIPTEAQSFQSRARNKILNNLKTLLDNGKIKIPRNPEDMIATRFSDKLEAELLAMNEVTSKATNITSYISSAAHDDLVMALAMAVKKVRGARAFEDPWGIA